MEGTINFFPRVFPLVKSNTILIYYLILSQSVPGFYYFTVLHKIYLITVKFACLQNTHLHVLQPPSPPQDLHLSHSASPSIRSIHPTISCSLCSSVSLAFPQCFQGDKPAGTVLSCWDLVTTDHFLSSVTKAWPQWSDTTTQLCLFGSRAKQLKRQKEKPTTISKCKTQQLFISQQHSAILLHTGLHSSEDAEAASFFQGNF